MVTLPLEFVATKYPGYFWNLDTRTLFSLKVTGVLRELKKVHPNRFSRITESGYYVSVRGAKKFLPLSYLLSLVPKDSRIPVESRKGAF